jgi:hypothetical protein
MYWVAARASEAASSPEPEKQKNEAVLLYQKTWLYLYVLFIDTPRVHMLDYVSPREKETKCQKRGAV